MKTYQLKPLEQFVGRWLGKDMTFEANGKAHKIEVFFEIVEILDGWGLRSFMRAEIPDFGTFMEIDMWGHDPGTDTIHLFTITNAGQTHDHSGKFRDDNTLLLQYRGKADGRNVREDITLAVIDDELVFHNKERANGKIEVVFEGILKRIPDEERSPEPQGP